MTPELMTALPSANQRFYEALLEAMTRVERLPNVEAVGLSSDLPLSTRVFIGMPYRVQVAGRQWPSDPRALPTVTPQLASSGYFDVLRLRLRSGRLFTRLDGAGSPRVVVVNEAFEREVFGGEPAVGQRVHLGGGGSSEPWEVIGVVGDITYRGLARSQPRAETFVPVRQAETEFVLQTPFVTVRTAGDPLRVIPFLREAVAEAHPRATIGDVMTMEARLSAAVAQPRFYAGFVGFFGGLALFLAAFGVYGLLSYTVAQQRREIGVRMALGAQRGDILTLVVRQGAVLIAVGAVVGLAAAAASSRVLESFLYGVTTDDRLTFVLAPLVLVAVAVFACWLPARRATRVDPMDALRVE